MPTTFNRLSSQALRLVHLRRAIIFLVLVLTIWIFFPTHTAKSFSDRLTGSKVHATQDAPYHPYAPDKNQTLHILIPATKQDRNLCKLMFSSSVLDYPPPTVIAWGQQVDETKTEGLFGGGTHLFKISKVLEWLESVTPEHDDDLVLMMDGYDIWFQLPKEVLIERYYRVIADANERIQRRMGRAARIEDIRQTIIFGSGKRCYPNEIHTVACWPLPPSPLPEDMWGGNTDGTIGSMPNGWASTRQRFLNSGVIMGPAKDMRRLFKRAAAKVQELGDDPEPDDNGSRWSEKVYHNSDQSIFNMIFGEQEYQREVIRIRHISWLFNPIQKLQQLFGKDLSDTDLTLEGNRIGNILNPPWSHANIEHLPGKPLEFGIGLDYWSLLAFQTANSERNGGWLHYDQDLAIQVDNHERWDCIPHLQPLPSDILASQPPMISKADGQSNPSADEASLTPASWQDVSLYTNICAGTVPVMVHLNGDKSQRDRDWKHLWFAPDAEALGNAAPAREGISFSKGVFSGDASSNGNGVDPSSSVGGREEHRQMLNAGVAFSGAGQVLDFAEICKDWDLT